MFLIIFYISLQKSIIGGFQNSHTIFIMSVTRKEKSVFHYRKFSKKLCTYKNIITKKRILNRFMNINIYLSI